MYHGIPRKVKPGLRFRIDFWFSCIDLRIGPVSFMFGKDFRSGRCGPKMHAPGRRKVAFGFMLRSFEWLPNSGGSNFSHSQSDLADCDVGFSLECKLNYCVGTQTHTHTHPWFEWPPYSDRKTAPCSTAFDPAKHEKTLLLETRTQSSLGRFAHVLLLSQSLHHPTGPARAWRVHLAGATQRGSNVR